MKIVKKSLFVFMFILVLVFIWGQAPPTLEKGVEIPICVQSGNQNNAQIWRDIIVWQDYRQGLNTSDCYMYDLSAGIETPIIIDEYHQAFPRIQGNRIVWADSRWNFYDIYMYDIKDKTTTRITEDLTCESYPTIWEDRIVWAQYGTGCSSYPDGPKMLSLDLTTGITTQIASNPWPDYWMVRPVIWKNLVVWEDADGIHMYDFNTGFESQISYALSLYPDIWEDQIVWQDFRTGSMNIYTYNTTTGIEIPITNTQYGVNLPSIWGNRIVWSELRNNNYDIFMYDLSTGTETQITADPYVQIDPEIWRNRIVYEDRRSGDSDIYLYIIPVPPEESIAYLREDVENLLESGDLDPEDANRLLMFLDQAEGSLYGSTNNDACGHLRPFIGYVSGLINSGSLGEYEGKKLINAANELIDELRG